MDVRHKRKVYPGIVAAVVVALLLTVLPGALDVLASAPDTHLYKVQTYGACTDNTAYRVAVAGVGMGGVNSGTLTLNPPLPSGATVEQAWLYWNGTDPDDTSGGGDGNVAFNANVLSTGLGTAQLFAGPAFWATNRFAYAYRADVTSYVSPSTSSYTFTDPYSSDPDQFDIPNGAALVVIYKDTSVTKPRIVEVWQGMDLAQGSSAPVGSEGTQPVIFEFAPAAVPRTVTLTTVVGGIANGQDAEVYYLVGNGSTPSGDIYSMSGVGSAPLPAESEGKFMTVHQLSVTVPAGATWVAVQVRSPDTNGALVHWLVETFEMEAACPGVEVTKTLVTPSSGLAHVNDTVSFQITIRNTGNTTLTEVPLVDTYDSAYLTNPSPSLTPDGAIPGSLTWNDINQAVGDLAPGDTATLTIDFDAKAGTQNEPGDVTTNTATVSGAKDQNQKSPPDAADSADVEISNPSFTITKERITPAAPDDIITVGEQVAYRITIANTGDTALVTVPLVDTFDSSKLTLVSSSISPDGNTPAGTLTWNDLTGSGVLAPNTSISVDLTFEAIASTAGAITTNTARSEGVVDENNETLPTQEDSANVRITNPCVSITKTIQGDSIVPVGGTVTYEIVVTNCGDTTLVTIPVKDTFPTAYLDYASSTLSPTTTDESTGIITWDDVTGTGSLAPNASLSFTVSFDAKVSSHPNKLVNRVETQQPTDENGDHPQDDWDEDNTLIITRPEVTVTKERVTTSPVLVQDTVQFLITVENTGNTAISTLPLKDTFDDTKLQFVSATPSPNSQSNGLLEWSDLTGTGSLAVGDSVTVLVTFKALASTTPNTTINTATVTGAIDENGDTVPDASDTADVAILTPASVGDYVWVDENGDGIQQTSEAPLSGVTVELYDNSDTLVASTTTDSNGYYQFSNLYPGQYYVKFTKLSGYEFTAVDQGSDDAKDSDANPSTGKTPLFTLNEGDNADTWDAGLYQPASIGNFVWEDVNGNGIQDSGEGGISNVTVNLYGAGPNGTFGDADDISATTTTDANGFYEFTNLAPGTYYVEFVLPSGYAFTQKDQGSDDAADSDADPTTGKTDTTALVSGETDLTWDAGMYRPATIGDFTWADTNGNGVYDSGESPLANVTLSLYDANNNLLSTTQSDSNGIYHFDNLAPGTYTVIATTPNGYVATTTTAHTRTVQSGDVVDDADFGFISPTAVELLAFETEVTPEGVRITWRTLSEAGVTGFRIQRSVVYAGQWVNLTSEPIPAQGADGRGATYSYMDGDVQPGLTYYYRLVVEPEGDILGPWSVAVPKSWDPGAGVQGGHRQFIPFLSR